MKSEHRHELVQNDLEKLIEKWRSRYAYLVAEHGNRLLLWLSALLLLVAAFVYYSRTAGSADTQGWSALMGARTPEDLAGIAESYKGTPVGQWAQLGMGERYLRNGIQLLFTDRDAAPADLAEARAAFDALILQTKTSPEVRERALFGLARTLEATSTGDLQPALQAYENLLAEFPDTPYKSLVEDALTRLKKQNTQDFYAWFAVQKPAPKDRDQPSDLLKSLNLEGLTLPTETPDDKAMPAPPEETPATETSAQPGPALTVPSAPEFPPTGTAKPEKKPDGAATPETKSETKSETKPDETKPDSKPEEPAPEKPAPESPKPSDPAEPKPAEPSADAGN